MVDSRAMVESLATVDKCRQDIHCSHHGWTTIKERIKLAFARVGFPAIPGYQVGSIANRFFWLLRGLKADD
jgi:hypothetical protein